MSDVGYIFLHTSICKLQQQLAHHVSSVGHLNTKNISIYLLSLPLSAVLGVMANTLFISTQAKEAYHARCLEYEKLKREGASQKDLEKVSFC